MMMKEAEADSVSAPGQIPASKALYDIRLYTDSNRSKKER